MAQGEGGLTLALAVLLVEVDGLVGVAIEEGQLVHWRQGQGQRVVHAEDTLEGAVAADQLPKLRLAHQLVEVSVHRV